MIIECKGKPGDEIYREAIFVILIASQTKVERHHDQEIRYDHKTRYACLHLDPVIVVASQTL